jgi:hypothetical protein
MPRCILCNRAFFFIRNTKEGLKLNPPYYTSLSKFVAGFGYFLMLLANFIFPTYIM